MTRASRAFTRAVKNRLPAVAQLKGLSGFNTTNRIGSAVLTGAVGDPAGMNYILCGRITTQVANAYLCDFFLDNTGKGAYIIQDTATSVVGNFGDIGGVFQPSPKYYPAQHLGRDQMLVFGHSGAGGYIDQYAGASGESGAKVGAGKSTSGFQVATSGSSRLTLGCRSSGTGAHTGITLYAIGAYGALTKSQIHAIYDYFYEHGTLPTSFGATHVYNLALDIDAAGGSVPTTILDRVGSAHLSFYAGSAPGGHSVVTNTPDFVHTNVPPPDRDIILAMGDSMTDGRGDAADLATVVPGYEPLDGSMWMLRVPSAGTPYAWAELDEPCGTRDPSIQTACVSPWGLLAWEIKKLTKRQIAVINGGVGSSLSSTWVPGQSNYESFRARFEVACSRRNATLRLVGIYGGPNDALQVSPPDYAANITAMLADIAARCGVTIPVVLHSKLTAYVPTDQSYPSWATTQAAIASLAGSNHLLITPPSPANLEGYNLHHRTDQNYTIALSGLALLRAHSSWWV